MDAAHEPARRRSHRRLFHVLATALSIAVPGFGASAQEPIVWPPVADTATVYAITLRDGTTVNGSIVHRDDETVTVRTVGGARVTLRRTDVRSVRRTRGFLVGGEVWPADPSESRLFLAPTARVPRHGHGYIGLYEIFVASGGIGIADRAMVSAGMSILPGIDLNDQVFYVAPKVQLYTTDRVQTAIGGFWVRPLTDEQSAGMAFASATTGTARASVSGGLAFPFTSRTGFARQQLAWLGAEVRATQHGKLITENWFVPGEDAAILSLGFRIIYETVTVEVAAVTSTETGGLLPVVNFSLAW